MSTKLEQAKIIIKKESLEIIKKIRFSQQKTQHDIGGLEAQKHEALHFLAECANEMKQEMAKIEKEFGKGTLDLETGVFAPEENETTEEVSD
tara:strand:+ start:386 stop:661 length:276 start_codon:yes stop_codon:yes gene_type:complete